MTSRSRNAVRPRLARNLAPLREQRGRREDRGARCTRGLVCKVRKRQRTRAYRFSGGIRPSLRNGFTAYFVLSPVNGFLATVALEKLKNLTPAPRRQDHTTSPYASGAFVLRASRVHRISPHVRDDRDPPLVCRETRGFKSLICPTARAEYFCAKDWTDFWVICPSGCFVAVKATLRHCERSEAIHTSTRG